jgi:deoxyribose-phosphate aldolase
VKVRETEAVARAGADEIDMVVPIGLLKARDYRAVFEDVRAVVEAAGAMAVKVILETALLDEREKAVGCMLAECAGAAFVKTSTGFAPAGASVEDVRLMKRVVGDRLGIKAAGGLRNFRMARDLIAAGATTIGSSASVTIVSAQAGD